MNGLNIMNAPALIGSVEAESCRPVVQERWLHPGTEFLFTGRAAFRKLEKLVGELCKTTDDSFDIVVVLLPHKLTIQEVRYTEASTIFVCDGHARNKFELISINNGHPFCATIGIMPKRSRTRLVTEFVDQSYSPPARPR